MPPQPVTGTFEIHIFVTPLDPPAELAERFAAACRGSADTPTMKGLLLHLDYEDVGFVGVLQSSRYVRGTLDHARAEADADAAILAGAGLEVVRRKVEAVTTNDGVPRTALDAERADPDRYFEFHVLVDGQAGPISNDDVASVRGIATGMRAQLGRPVRLSYNALKPGQRFLNLRAQGVGLDEAQHVVSDLEQRIGASGELRVVKTISEYVCADDNRAIDRGWLDPR